RGTLRFSGNDITKAKGKDLIEFVNAGYPVILDEKFDNNNSKGKSYLDTASNAYSMYQAIKDENNVFYADQFTGSSSDTTKESLKKYLVKPKLNINGIELGIPRIEDEHQYLDYKFTISNDLELDSSTRYFADLFFDLNTDGRYTKETELQSDVIYLNSDGEAIEPDENGKCLLKSNEAYTVRKELPNTYSGPLAWKLLVSINGENIHTSLSDCSEINLELGEGKVINILQIVPNTGNTLDLANKLNSGTWHNELSEMGYNMHIKKITASYFSSNYNNEFETGRRLKDYDMLILGFGNRWQEISDPKAVNKINEYIESGKSVLFTHDTTSYCNVDDEAEISTIFDASDYWGYHVNSILRQRLGLDRYGINTWDIANSKYNDVAVELRRAQIINNPDNYSSKIKSTNDKAYVVDNLNSTYPETQGYTNPTLDNLNASNLRSFISDIFGTNNPFGNKTFYYSLRADSGVKIGGTRVWDKLLDLINLIFDSGSDMINSGHQMYINQINSGQLTRFPYNLEGENGELASINIEPTHFQSYQIDMDNIDSNGNSDIVVWYTIGGEKNKTGTEVSTPYSASPNDVRNNYYIYSKGNVMYSGAGHSTIKTNTNSKEFKLFLNTMIAAYRLGLQNPNVTILNNKNRDSGSRGVAYFAYDSDNAGEPVNGTSDIYFTVNNPNLNITDSVTTVKYSDDNGVIHNVKTYRVTSDGDKVLTDNKVISGRVYRAELPKSLSKYLENNSGEINVSIENTFKHYGEAGTLNADAELMLTRFTLKELQ
ncbi:MAG: DUF5057 domain-containing protein, partial [Clostridiales bacterium]|nr:DUF5057 domain-containing protein [Clostridiales bacterium]